MKNLSLLLKGLLAALLMLISLSDTSAQAPNWQAVAAPSQAASDNSSVYSTAVDAAGHVYMTGPFTGTISFGATVLTSAGRDDIFIAKWNPVTATFMWAYRAGGARTDRAFAIAVSGANIYVTGDFRSTTIDFGSVSLTNTDTGTDPDRDVFVVKLTDAGTSASFVWAQRAGGSESEEVAYALAVEGNRVYLAGFVRSETSTFGNTVLTKVRADDGGQTTDAFVAKLTDAGSTGSFVWAKLAGGNHFDYAQAIAVTEGNVYVSGVFDSSTATFGGITLINTTDTGTSRYGQSFIAKLSDLGSDAGFVWVQQVSGGGNNSATGLAVKGANLYLAGGFLNMASLGGLTLNAVGGYDGYVAKLLDAGNTSSFVWAQRVGGTGADAMHAVQVSEAGVYVAGRFTGPASFGTTALTGAGGADALLAKFVDKGNVGELNWVQTGGGTGDDFSDVVSVTSSGVVYVGGTVAPPATFGAYSIRSPSAARVGFLASLTDATLTPTTPARPALALTLAPNPARTATTVRLHAVPGATTATLTLLDALGRSVRTRTAALPPAGLRYELGLTGLPAGIYALQVAAGAARATQRLVVE